MRFIFFLICFVFLFWVPRTVGQDSDQEALDMAQRALDCFQAEDIECALSIYERLVPYFQEENMPYWLAHTYLYLGEVYNLKGSNSDALDYTYKSKSVLEKHFLVDTVHFYSLLLQNLGVFHNYQGDYDKQLDYYRQSYVQAEKRHGRLSKQMSEAYYSLGAAFGTRGYWDRCIAYTDTSLQIAEEVGHQEGINSALHNLAYAYGIKRDFQRAVDYQERALRETESLDLKAQGLHNLGYWHLDLGEYRKALDVFDQALDIRTTHFPENTLDIVSTKLAIVDATYETGQFRKIQSMLDTIILMLRPLDSPYSRYYLQTALNKKAGAYTRNKQDSKARQVAAQAVAVNTASPTVMSSSYLMLAAAESSLQEYDQALNHIQLALEYILPGFDAQDPLKNPTAEEAADRENVLDALHIKAATLYLMGLEEPGANDYLLKSLETYMLEDSIIHQMRLQFQYPSSKEALFQGTRYVYSAAMRTCNALYKRTGDLHYLDLAFQFSEKNRGQLVAENLNDLYVRKFARVDDRLIAEERRLLSDIAFYERELQWAEDYYGPEKSEAFTESLQQSRVRLKEVWKEMETRYPDYYRVRHAFDVAGIEAMQERVIEADETLIEYFLGDTALYIFVATPGKADWVRHSIPATFQEDILRFRMAILKQDNEYWSLGHSLYQQLIQPVAHLLEGEKVCLVPDGVLGYIPFEALLYRPVDAEGAEESREHPFLMKEYRIRYLISGQVALQAGQRTEHRAPKRGILAMAPSFDEMVAENAVRQSSDGVLLPRLDGAIREVEQLRKKFSGLFLQNQSATEKAFWDYASDYSVLHIATHTLIEDQFPSFSRLLFNRSKDSTYDGELKAYEIYGMPLEAELITLSACNTGFGAIKEGEGIYSLGRAFAYAGASNLVMTLWPVKDKTTAFLVERFYDNLAGGMGKAEALQEAKLHYLTEYPSSLLVHPYYWAGFLYMGDTEPLELKEKTAFMGIPLAVFLPALLGLLVVLILIWRFWSSVR